jgi:glycosyltransferase involved in cell wall biosynthesis
MGTCEWTRQRYLSLGLPSDRVFMTYLGLDLDRFVPQAPGRLRAELNLAPETPVIGMVSYFYAPKRMLGQRRGLKGHEDLIDALELVFAHEPNAAAVFVGGAWANANAYEERVKAYARAKLGSRVHFLGTRNDVQQLYADIDLAVHPSHSENVGGAAESMLLGVPTIATDVGGFPDIVKPGRTGWLVPPRDPRALAGAIDEALADPDQTARMAENGRVLAREVLDRRRNVQELLSAYESIVHGQGRIAA